MADVRVGDTAVSASEFADGATPFFDSSVDNTAQVLKASSGRLYGLEVSNPNESDAYLQIFDTAAGSVTVGTTAPKQSYLIPKGSATGRGAFDRIFVVPLQFDTAITYAATTTPTGSGNPATALTLNAWYR